MNKRDEQKLRELNITSYQDEYTESKLLAKLQRVAKKAGAKVVYAALLGYYVVADKNVPFDAKAKIIGALGYFILPLDLIPDAIPMAGYTDDLTALFWALKSVYENVTPEIEAKAKSKLLDWFDQVDEADIQLF